ncbi:MAG: uridine kinase [Candidatus Micrarchaeota archaeon]|nr:MAG: uridine kinase [Candidatus Micrarchaeota archaeon]
MTTVSKLNSEENKSSDYATFILKAVPDLNYANVKRVKIAYLEGGLEVYQIDDGNLRSYMMRVNGADIELTRDQFLKIWNNTAAKIEKTVYTLRTDNNNEAIEIHSYEGNLEGLVLALVPMNTRIDEIYIKELSNNIINDVSNNHTYDDTELARADILGSFRLRRGLDPKLKGMDFESAVKEIKEEVKFLNKKLRRPVVIIIAGASGSGKTTLASMLYREIPRSVVISTDNYYIGIKRMKEKGIDDFDLPEAIDNDLLKEHIRALRELKSIEMPIYSFKSGEREGYINVDPIKDNEHIEAIIVEGIYSLQSFSELGDINIYILITPHDARIRRYGRDTNRTSWPLNDIISYELYKVAPKFPLYIMPQEARANTVLENRYNPNREGVELIKGIEKQFKFKLSEDDLAKVYRAISASYAEILANSKQIDIYLKIPEGHKGEQLKLRIEGDQIIFEYKFVAYDGTRRRLMVPITEVEFARLLSEYKQISHIVSKYRTLYSINGINFTVDRDVRVITFNDNMQKECRLGSFIEIKNPKSDDDINWIKKLLGLEGNPIEDSYIDLADRI